jgi:putative endonuclease
MRYSYIYILSNKSNRVFYVGVCDQLIKRVYQHKQKLTPGFTSKYNVDRLVYYETFEDITEAINREKQIKGGSRQKKIDLIKAMNPEWKDLYEEIASA